MKRRTIIKGGAAMLGVTALGGYSLLENVGLSYAGPPQGFNTTLPIPPLLDVRTIGGVKTYQIDIDKGEMSFFPGYTTPTLGYNGPYLGPTIKVRNGEKVNIKVNNKKNVKLKPSKYHI